MGVILKSALCIFLLNFFYVTQCKISSDGVNSLDQKNSSNASYNINAGRCYKEVETSSLQREGQSVVAGNGSQPNLSVIQVCCKGYERNRYIFRQCDPVCTNGCQNGQCVAPEKCACFKNYVPDLTGKCVPTCPIACVNGVCDQSNSTCICNKGYELAPNKLFCVPKCNSTCLNGNCTAPDVCECKDGYRMSAETKQCEPICSADCEKGKCIAPGACSCADGRVIVNGECVPYCPGGCNGGECVNFNECRCKSGWDLIKDTCVPFCTKPCFNGKCTGPNQCTCNPGYMVHPLDAMKCDAICRPTCAHGVCTAPNVCICNSGYVKRVNSKGFNTCQRVR